MRKLYQYYYTETHRIDLPYSYIRFIALYSFGLHISKPLYKKLINIYTELLKNYPNLYIGPPPYL